ncbi:hypothetical protein JCGZ_17081 [Jatropha curcas]|uniref:Uncharacterized protein n=1 Tax=Jatropha curcas TaxID=180498 RepID=A0A067LE45_JATCU|nr:hypothetical protein JCGZ_17081 [Jatropha curcas]
MVVSPSESHHRNRRRGNVQVTKRSRLEVSLLTAFTDNSENSRKTLSHSVARGPVATILVLGTISTKQSHRWLPLDVLFDLVSRLTDFNGRRPVIGGEAEKNAPEKKKKRKRKKKGDSKEFRAISVQFDSVSTWFMGFSPGFQKNQAG